MIIFYIFCFIAIYINIYYLFKDIDTLTDMLLKLQSKN